MPIIGVGKRHMNGSRTVSNAKYILGSKATLEHKKQGKFCTKSIIFYVTDVTVWLKSYIWSILYKFEQRSFLTTFSNIHLHVPLQRSYIKGRGCCATDYFAKANKEKKASLFNFVMHVCKKTPVIPYIIKQN